MDEIVEKPELVNTVAIISENPKPEFPKPFEITKWLLLFYLLLYFGFILIRLNCFQMNVLLILLLSMHLLVVLETVLAL